jgi:hypothetical protein
MRDSECTDLTAHKSYTGYERLVVVVLRVESGGVVMTPIILGAGAATALQNKVEAAE